MYGERRFDAERLCTIFGSEGTLRVPALAMLEGVPRSWPRGNEESSLRNASSLSYQIVATRNPI